MRPPSPFVCWEEVSGTLGGARGGFTGMELIREAFLSV